MNIPLFEKTKDGLVEVPLEQAAALRHHRPYERLYIEVDILLKRGRRRVTITVS